MSLESKLYSRKAEELRRADRDNKKSISKALDKKKAKPFQVSKEHFNGKYQKVGFYEGKNGVDVRPIKD